jgi:2-succinyl-5-enolpyruvyl-6-hydroxy-3-cyclohexene-1-carboxylate synthase
LVDTFVESSGEELAIYSQRGAAGIDGLISGAAGSASISREPFGLLLGDVSFLHDTNGLALAARVGAPPLVITVIQNRGGRIFEQLPIAKSGADSELLDHLITPHQIELEPLCRGFGLRHVRCEEPAGLERELTAAYGTSGCTVLEAIVPPRDAVRAFEQVWSATNAAIGGLA